MERVLQPYERDGLGIPLFVPPDAELAEHHDAMLADWSLIMFTDAAAINDGVLAITDTMAVRFQPFITHVGARLLGKGYNGGPYFQTLDNTIPLLTRIIYVVQEGFRNTVWTVEELNDMRTEILQIFPVTDDYGTTGTRKISNIDVLCICCVLSEDLQLDPILFASHNDIHHAVQHTDWLVMTIVDLITMFGVGGLVPSATGLLCSHAKPPGSVLLRTVCPLILAPERPLYGCGLLRCIPIDDYSVNGNDNRITITTNVRCIYTAILGVLPVTERMESAQRFHIVSLILNDREPLHAESWISVNVSNFVPGAIELVLGTEFHPLPTEVPPPILLDVSPASVWESIYEYRDLATDIVLQRRANPTFFPELDLGQVWARRDSSLASIIANRAELNVYIVDHDGFSIEADALRTAILDGEAMFAKLELELFIREQEAERDTLREYIDTHLQMTW